MGSYVKTVIAGRLQYNGFNQLLSVTSPSGVPTSFQYDGNGNQVSKTDGLGTTTYSYNQDNRLVDISGPAGLSHFEYDANGLRTKKSDSTGTRSYLLDGLSVVAEYAPDASKLAWYTQSLARIDEVLSVVNGQGKYWYETDALGSTYAMTSTAGAVASRSSYDVFGERSLASAYDVGQPFGFTGREQDPSGLVYARARYLQPGSGRWTQADRISMATARNGGLVAEPGLGQLLRAAGGIISDISEYKYAANTPTIRGDPSGLTVLYIGVGGTAATFSGGVTAGLGMGLGGSPFGLGFLGTIGLAQQVYGLVNISASVDVGIYPFLDHDSICDLKGAFLVQGVDWGIGYSLAWSVKTSVLEAALAHGTLAFPVLGRPVGVTFSFPLLPKGWVPPGGMTLYGTWSWLLKGWGCGC